MQAYEQFNLILCIIVFIAFTLVFSAMITIIVKLSLKTIRAGIDDEKIKEEYLQEKNQKKNRLVTILSSAVPILVCAILACALGFSLYARFSQNSKVGKIPTFKVVETGSMETKNKANDYLFDNNLNDQIATFDLVLLHQLPKEEDLKLYDIVVYEINGYFIIHRIVGIEEPNIHHPDERWFVLRGDANIYADDFPVTYDQMSSIYRGEAVHHVGMIVIFMQSPAGMLCFLLILFAIIVTPIIEKILGEAVHNRLLAMGLLSEVQEEVAVAQAPVAGTAPPSGETTPAETVQAVPEEANPTGSVQAVVEAPVEEKASMEKEEKTVFNRFSNFGNRKTFEERLRLLNEETSEWHRRLSDALKKVPSVRQTKARYHELYKKGNKGIAKITIKGKSLYVYLAVDPAEYATSRYGIKDVSSIKAYLHYPAKCKVTSNRKLKYLIEIIEKL